MRVNAASNGTHAVAVCELPSGIACLKYAPSSAGHLCNRQEFDALFTRAAGKLGYKRDGRCRTGWRKHKENPSCTT